MRENLPSSHSSRALDGDPTTSERSIMILLTQELNINFEFPIVCEEMEQRQGPSPTRPGHVILTLASRSPLSQSLSRAPRARPINRPIDHPRMKNRNLVLACGGTKKKKKEETQSPTPEIIISLQRPEHFELFARGHHPEGNTGWRAFAEFGS